MFDIVPFHTQQDRHHETTTNRKRLKTDLSTMYIVGIPTSVLYYIFSVPSAFLLALDGVWLVVGLIIGAGDTFIYIDY